MKTFRDLNRDDIIVVKNFKSYIDCDKCINGHHYVQEILMEEVYGIITAAPNLHHIQSEGKWFQLQITVPQKGITYLATLPDSDIDKTENERFKIYQYPED